MQLPTAHRETIWVKRLRRFRERAKETMPLVVEGRLTRMVGLAIEAVGCQIAIGGRCLIRTVDGGEVEAEVVGFSGSSLYLMPVGSTQGLAPNARVIPARRGCEAAVGPALLGRVLDATGAPLDGKGPLQCDQRVALTRQPVNPLSRGSIQEPLDVGVRSINALATIGRGQRIGLFAGSGVGKSVLLGMMTRYTNADVTVVGLIGERGREVKEFVQNTLGKEGMHKAVVIAAPADQPPLMRLHGAWLATAVAEYFRDQGLKVLLLMDSLTRVAQAQREIALAVGEPPATKGYPPSVFAKIPQLVERAGCGDAQTGGSITAFYTVLTEGDDHNDPIADASRAILDGHVVLSRQISEAGIYPALDIETSISRLMQDVVDRESMLAARRFRQLYSTYQQNRDMISVGAYQTGSDPRVDEAIAYYPKLVEFLQQDMGEAVSLQQSLTQIKDLTAIRDEGGMSQGADEEKREWPVQNA